MTEPFVFLKNEEREALLPQLFALRYANLHPDAPEYTDQELKDWIDHMLPLLDEPKRGIMMMYTDEEMLAGYLLYSVDGHVLQLEDAQLTPEQRRTRLFYRSCLALIEHLPPRVLYFDDYVSKDNTRAILLNQKLGMQIIGSDVTDTKYRMRISVPDLQRRFTGVHASEID